MCFKKIRKEHGKGIYCNKNLRDIFPFLSSSDNRNVKVCVCGQPEETHKHAAETPDTGWSIEKNTFELIDSAYGYISDGALVKGRDV